MLLIILRSDEARHRGTTSSNRHCASVRSAVCARFCGLWHHLGTFDEVIQGWCLQCSVPDRYGCFPCAWDLRIFGQDYANSNIYWKCKTLLLLDFMFSLLALCIICIIIRQFCQYLFFEVWIIAFVGVCLMRVIFFQKSVSFAHQLGTRVRISLMRSISRRQKEHDPNAICSISAFTARPLLRCDFWYLFY